MYSRLIIAGREKSENAELRRPGEIRQRLGYQHKGEKETESSMAARNFYFI